MEKKTSKTEDVYLPDIIGGGYASFWNTKKFFRVVKGGRASKKSTTAAMWYIYNMMKYELSNTVVVRKVYNTHKNSTFAELKKAARRLKVRHLWKFTESPLECTYLPTGQKILFYGFDDPTKLTSMTVDVGYLCWVWFEEIFEIDNEEDFNTFVEGVRGALPEPLFKQITLTYNPWIMTHWTKPRFWDGPCPEDTFRDTTTHKDNEFLDEADHKRIEDLQKTNPERYKVVGLGDYGLPGGTYFEEFRSDIHVIEPFKIPKWWIHFRAADYGLDMFACGWFAVDGHGNVILYRDYEDSGLKPSEAGKKMVDLTDKDEDCRYTVLSPDLFKKNERESGKPEADYFKDAGVKNLRKANNRRVPGWHNVSEFLKVIETTDNEGNPIKTAKFKIFKTCLNTIRTLPAVAHDEKYYDDVADEPHELTHTPEMLRYGLMTRVKKSTEKKPDKLKEAAAKAKEEGDTIRAEVIERVMAVQKQRKKARNVGDII
jgi:phage terminase large subunit